MQSWRAYYFDGESAARHEVTLTLELVGVRFTHADGTHRLWPYAELRQTQGAVKGEQVRFERGGAIAEAILVRDPGFLDALRAMAPADAHFAAPPRRGVATLRLMLLAVGVLALVLGAYFVGIPTFAGALAQVVPVSWEEALGNYVLNEVVSKEQRCNDPRVVKPVTAIVQRLLAAGPKTPYHYHVIVADVPEVNAFALPGGDIVVFTGILTKTKSPEELAGVLAHEIQHVQCRHATKSLIRRASLGLLLASVTGNHSALGHVVGVAGNLGMLGYSRKDEAQADRRGMRLLEAAKIDPYAMVRMFEMLEKEAPDLPQGLDFLSDHPDTAARLRAMRRMAAAAHYKPVPLLPGVNWAAVGRSAFADQRAAFLKSIASLDGARRAQARRAGKPRASSRGSKVSSTAR